MGQCVATNIGRNAETSTERLQGQTKQLGQGLAVISHEVLHMRFLTLKLCILKRLEK